MLDAGRLLRFLLCTKLLRAILLRPELLRPELLCPDMLCPGPLLRFVLSAVLLPSPAGWLLPQVQELVPPRLLRHVLRILLRAELL